MHLDREVVVGGVRLHYRETGPADAPAIVALHAMGQDATAWDPIAARLAERWRVLAPDQRGHGSSDRTAEYAFELLRDDAAAFVEALGVGPVVLLGHSMGGTAAILFAERRPDLVRLLVLEDTPPARRTGPRWRYPDAPPPGLVLDPAAWLPLMGQLADPDPRWWDDLAAITAPTLVVGGGEPSFVDQDELAVAARCIPGGHMVTVPDAGHQVHATHPDAFLAHLADALAALPG